MQKIIHLYLLGIQRIDKRDFELLIHMKFLPGGDMQRLYRKKIVENPNYYVPEDTILFWAH